jgi:hypothetical protein
VDGLCVAICGPIIFGDCKSFDTELVWCHGHKIISTPCKD